ncbi:hypothetical protein [Burkholderia gladioli]|uniref:hypothetical protein n=1 Tax=Burkholderia gladioli TaxID=28095 RepID=UPI00164006E8|nr:hypothetical protein [Burkholderia gladioli]
MCGENKIRSTHFWYWIGILSLLLILSITYHWTSQPRFTEYIGNAATLISLVLGVVAIFYSIVSNNSLSGSLGNISTASESLRRSEMEIKSILDHSKLLANNHEENIIKMAQISDSVRDSVTALSCTMEEVSVRTSELQFKFLQVPSQLEIIEKKLDEKSHAARPEVAKRKGFSEEEANYFNGFSSFYGNFVVYACVLAKRHDVVFSMVDLKKLFVASQGDLSEGFFDCMIAADIVGVEREGGEEDSFRVKYVDRRVEESIKKYIDEFIDRVFKDNAKARGWYRGIMNRMEDAFASGDIANFK